VALSFAFSLALAAVPAAAQDAKELKNARALFQQGIEAEQAGNWATAVQRFREVGQVRMTPQVRFHIALCEDRLGRLVVALGGYELALADADSVGPEFRAEVERNVSQLRARIPKLVIERGAGAEAAVIELDGVAVGDSSVGVEVPQDPGPHAIIARAPNYHAFDQTVTLAEGETKRVEIVLLPLPKKAPPPLAGAADGGQAAAQPISKLRMTSYIVGGVGAASLLTSGVLFALRQSTLSGLEDACNDMMECPKSEEGAYDRLKTYHYGALVTLGVGVAAVGTGAVLFVMDRNQRDQEKAHAAGRLRLYPSVAPGSYGVAGVMRF
jgi:hypothetical protein